MCLFVGCGSLCVVCCLFVVVYVRIVRCVCIGCCALRLDYCWSCVDCCSLFVV